MNMEGKDSRYSRQILFQGIGSLGQSRLQSSSAVIVGCGALGSVIADRMVRSGVGRIRIIDRDFVETSNLQRQLLFDEEDAVKKLPKAVSAVMKLEKINSEIQTEAVVDDVNHMNVEELLKGFDLILDASDNMEIRFLINDYCVYRDVPWIYGGAVGSTGMTHTIIPGKTACLRCFTNEIPAPGTTLTCEHIGVLNAITAVIGAIQSSEALRILSGNPGLDNRLVFFDVWERRFSDFKLEINPLCPACGKREFEFLQGNHSADIITLCGRNSIQISPVTEVKMDLTLLNEKLSRSGRTKYNGFFLSFYVEGYELAIFPDSRIIIKGTVSESTARNLVSKYIGN